MALKYRIEMREEIPAEQAALYVERDGAFYADVEGVVEKSKADELRAKVDEFRKTSLAKAQEYDAFKARFEGIEPEEVRKLADEKRRLEEEKQLKAGEVERVWENRMKNLKAEGDKQLATVTGERDALHTQLSVIQIDQGVTNAATKRGLKPTAIPDITARARNVFKLVNGVPRAFEADGTTVRYGRDGVTPMTLEEWVDHQTTDAPHLFESNAGGGAASNGSGGAGGVNRSVKNPFRNDTRNITEQMKLLKSDPGLAARLKAAA